MASQHRETEYFERHFTRGSELHDRPTTIHHWQLRDLVSPGEDEETVYVVWDTQVIKYNTLTKQSQAIMSLNFKPNSMTCRYGYLAAGGLRSELEVRNLRTNATCFKGSTGGQVNNALHIGKHSSGDLRLFVCNNDDTIKVYTLPSMAHVTTIRCHVPINYTCLSPDGTQLVAVGDCASTLVYAASAAGYTLLTTLTEASDVGMCCGWSHWGDLVGSAHQDGRACIWDARSGAVVAKYRFQSAARNIKFSPAPLDLVAVSEHEDVVHLIDGRRWDAMETLEPARASSSGRGGTGGVNGAAGVTGVTAAGGGFGAAGGVTRVAVRGGGRGYGGHWPYVAAEQDISGIAFSSSGRRLWVGMDRCVAVYDVDERGRRQFGVADML